MDLVLTYRGRIPAKRSDKVAVEAMRQAFHNQLEKLWGKQPFAILKTWEDSGFDGTPNILRVVEGRTYVPFFGSKIAVGVHLEITLLTGMPIQKRVLSAGDLDNRIKRIIDALRAPQSPDELDHGAMIPRQYCLMDDDDVVQRLSVTLGLDLVSDDPSEAFAFVRVRPVSLGVTLENLAMLF